MTQSQKTKMAKLMTLGLQPDDAALVVTRAAEAGKGGLTAEVLATLGTPTPEDQMRSRTWWLYNPAVPDEYKRLLDAGEI